MKASAADSQLGELQRAGGTLRLDVFLAYEDFQCGIRARRCLDRILKRLGCSAAANLVLWRLGLLNNPELRTIAEGEAASCDVVLLSMHCSLSLAGTTRAWMEAWLEQHADGAGALGVLLDLDSQRDPYETDMLAFLERAARRHSVEMFAGFLPATGESDGLTLEGIRHRAEFKSDLVEEILHHPDATPHWGINE